LTLYVDSSALVKRYVAEGDRAAAEHILLSDPEWVTGGHTYVEVALTLHDRLDGRGFSDARAVFERDWERTIVVSIDEALCRRAVDLGTLAGVRTLDALHLAAADRAVGRSAPIVTFDLRLAQAARSLGFSVVGV
jgi:predicted nucleic acid-binding protein